MKHSIKSNLIETPKFVGGYEITGSKKNTIVFNLCKKPSRINRFFCKACLGWTWIDR